LNLNSAFVQSQFFSTIAKQLALSLMSERITLIHPLVEAYAANYTTAQTALLQEIEAYTQAHHAQPHMLSGHVQGRLLSMLSQMLQPQRILEIGTFTGFSALCLAEGLQPNGQLHTIELRQEDAALAQGFFQKSVYHQQIHQHVGNALEVLDRLPETWDLVFIDADKVNYCNYYNKIFSHVRKNGFIIADNVFFHGDVLQTPVKGKNAIAMQAFNELVKADKNVEQVVLSVRDGLTLLRKL
jgi:caffeoyl-CoA O-methyltransferase